MSAYEHPNPVYYLFFIIAALVFLCGAVLIVRAREGGKTLSSDGRLQLAARRFKGWYCIGIAILIAVFNLTMSSPVRIHWGM